MTINAVSLARADSLPSCVNIARHQLTLSSQSRLAANNIKAESVWRANYKRTCKALS